MPEPDIIPISASVASTGKNIRYIGKWIYGYSGLFSAQTSPQTVFDFTSGSGIIVGVIQLNSAVDDDNSSLSLASTLNIKFNGVSIALLGAGADDAFPPSKSERTEVIIPPFTEVSMILDTTGTQADRYASATITGRVYGAA